MRESELRAVLDAGDALNLVGGSRNVQPLDPEHPGPSYRERWFQASKRWYEVSGRLRAVLVSSPAPAGMGEQAVAAIVEWCRRYNGQFGYDEQHAFVRERFDPIARAATRPAPAGLDESPAADDEAANQWQAMYPNVSYAARVAVRLWNRLIVAEGAATRPAEDADDLARKRLTEDNPLA